MRRFLFLLVVVVACGSLVWAVYSVQSEARRRASDVAREAAARVQDDCHLTQRQWDSIDSLARTIFAPTGSSPTSAAVLQILTKVGFTDADIQTLISNSAATNAAKLAAFEKQHGSRPAC